MYCPPLKVYHIGYESIAMSEERKKQLSNEILVTCEVEVYEMTIIHSTHLEGGGDTGAALN